jgi:diguanylate cyclase (GGDEF)-like protein
MPGKNERARGLVGAAEDAGGDPLAPLLEALLGASGLPTSELVRRVREALPAAIAEVAESNRRLRETAEAREALVASAVAELRAAAALFLPGAAPGPNLDEAARLRRLADELERSLRPPLDATEPRAAPAPRPKPRVLVVDDEPDAREVLEDLLRPDYDVATAPDGEAAVEVARAERPDVILMDLFMPRLDGLEALERLRADPATSDIPVIFVSARGDDALKARTLDLGAVDYLQKPFSDRELRARLERTLRLSRSQTALRELAQTDPLTGLANLRAFRARLDEEVKRARRYGTPLTAVMADMDHLKPVNDELGHAAGDRAIAAVAAVIRGELRETDFGARYGGDEFVLLLPHTSAEEGRVLAERVCARLKAVALGSPAGGSPSALRSGWPASRRTAPSPQRTRSCGRRTPRSTRRSAPGAAGSPWRAVKPKRTRRSSAEGHRPRGGVARPFTPRLAEGARGRERARARPLPGAGAFAGPYTLTPAAGSSPGGTSPPPSPPARSRASAA